MESGKDQSTISKRPNKQSVTIEMLPLKGQVAIEMPPVSEEVTGKYCLKHILYITLTYSQ